MTSVVGILNKRGVAIAADSAVTRSRRKENGICSDIITKCTKNGNKMVRLSNAVPVTVMFTGNAEFLETPWDVIARRYRQKRGDVAHPTVEAAAHDFFTFISENPVFWDDASVERNMRYVIGSTFRTISERAFNDEEYEDEFGAQFEISEEQKDLFITIFNREAKAMSALSAINGESPHYKGYSIDAFRNDVAELLDGFMLYKEGTDDYLCSSKLPASVLAAIRPSFEEALLAAISCRNENESYAELIFSGFGADQEYPSLVPVYVNEGFIFRVNYNIRPEDIICISDKKPVAICPFAQNDVIKSILRGTYANWYKNVVEDLTNVIDPLAINPPDLSIFDPAPGEEVPEGFYDKIERVKTWYLQSKFIREGNRMLDSTQREWEKNLKDYDLEEMAALADSLIALTGFHRILTFSQEGVGGLVDLAVISKADGFTWLRRKNWYHKDNGMSI